MIINEVNMETRAYYENKILDNLKNVPEGSLPAMYISILNIIEKIKRGIDNEATLDFCGKWQDERSAKEIIDDIYLSRTGYANRFV
jgi:hypothetical protein